MNIIPITRKLQEKYFYCGQACMQMLGATGTQDDLWQKSRPYMKEANKWYTDPAGISEIMQAEQGMSENIEIASDKMQVANSLVSTIKSSYPTILASRGGSH